MLLKKDVNCGRAIPFSTIRGKLESCERCPLSHLLNGTGLMFLSSCWQKLLQNKVNFGHAIPFSISRGKLEGFETCTMSSSIDGHWSHVSIFLLTKVITNRMLMLDAQFPFLPLGVKCKVVKDVHFPLLLMDTGLTSLSFF